MVDLISQYKELEPEIQKGFQEVLTTAHFIKGPKVSGFEKNLAEYLGVKHVIACANGTDALQIAMMAIGLKPGDEVLVPAFTYVATAEVIGLLGLTPVMVDVDQNTYNTTREYLESKITSKTRAIVPVHLYGQSSDMEDIMHLANEKNLFVIEDNAQAIGADYTFSDGKVQKTGTIGHIGCTSFFPSKNLGCYGDGGAMFTNDDNLAEKIRMVANHGQNKKYHHKILGVNSRLDALQAVVLDAKLSRLDKYSKARQSVANKYNEAFKNIVQIKTPEVAENSTHVYHQYTMQVSCTKDSCLRSSKCENNCHLRANLQEALLSKKIPSMIYYPIPLYDQEAFSKYHNGERFANTETLCNTVISLPIHTEMKQEVQDYIIKGVKDFFNN